MIASIDAEGNLQIRLDSGRDEHFNTHEHPHLDYGYAVTSHNSEGASAVRNAANLTPQRPVLRLLLS